MKLPETVRDTYARLRSEGQRLYDKLRGGQSRALVQLVRPNLGPTPRPLRRLLEPVVAVCAIAALVWLLAVGAVSFALLFAAGGLIYAILTYVFGLELAFTV